MTEGMIVRRGYEGERGREERKDDRGRRRMVGRGERRNVCVCMDMNE
jgi:hypothetical protein